MPDAPERMNDSGTRSPTNAESVHDRSGFDLEDTRRELIALRVKYGAERPVGHRASNIIQLLQQPNPPVALIQRQMAELERLLAGL